jgi:hypothetical protein
VGPFRLDRPAVFLAFWHGTWSTHRSVDTWAGSVNTVNR